MPWLLMQRAAVAGQKSFRTIRMGIITRNSPGSNLQNPILSPFTHQYLLIIAQPPATLRFVPLLGTVPLLFPLHPHHLQQPTVLANPTVLAPHRSASPPPAQRLAAHKRWQNNKTCKEKITLKKIKRFEFLFFSRSPAHPNHLPRVRLSWPSNADKHGR